MPTEIIVCILSLAGTITGSLIGCVASAKLTNFRLKQLEDKVAEHNNFAHRLPVIEEQIKVINHRLSDLERSE